MKAPLSTDLVACDCGSGELLRQGQVITHADWCAYKRHWDAIGEQMAAEPAAYFFTNHPEPDEL